MKFLKEILLFVMLGCTLGVTPANAIFDIMEGTAKIVRREQVMNVRVTIDGAEVSAQARKAMLEVKEYSRYPGSTDVIHLYRLSVLSEDMRENTVLSPREYQVFFDYRGKQRCIRCVPAFGEGGLVMKSSLEPCKKNHSRL